MFALPRIRSLDTHLKTVYNLMHQVNQPDKQTLLQEMFQILVQKIPKFPPFRQAATNKVNNLIVSCDMERCPAKKKKTNEKQQSAYFSAFGKLISKRVAAAGSN